MTAVAAERIGHPAQRERVAAIGEPRHQRADQALRCLGHILPMEEALALLAALRIGARLAEREQPGEPRPARAVLRPDEQRGAVDQIEPTPRDNSDVDAQRGKLLGGDQRAHHPAHRIAIDDPQRGEAEQGGLAEQLLGRGRAAQEREMRRHLKLGVPHPNTPWRYQLRSPVAARSPSPRRNSQ